ncbi:hypothetical protein [Fodinibacter luteus]
MTEEREQRRVSRRTIAKGAAWAVPAVPLAVATPAYAQSGCVPTLRFDPGSCRCTGEGQNDKDYFVRICNTGTQCPDTDGTLYVSIRAATGQNEKLYDTAIAVPVGGCSAVVKFQSDNSSSNLRFYYGATAAEANALDNPNYVTVDAPNDCNKPPEGVTPLGTCIQG